MLAGVIASPLAATGTAGEHSRRVTSAENEFRARLDCDPAAVHVLITLPMQSRHIMFTPFFNIGIADIADVFVVAVLLSHEVTAWLAMTRAAFIIRGIFILAAVYIIARYFDLQLTAWLFQGFWRSS